MGKEMRALVLDSLNLIHGSITEQDAQLEEIKQDIVSNAWVIDDPKVYATLFDYDRITNVWSFGDLP